ncbi:MAG: quinolinate synthase NadA [Clostridiales bacterium]|nr:quinolinate synthase NadA [Clostridiales bacterium]
MKMYAQIEKLKKQKNAVVLAHYYVPDEVQKAADFIGDSFYLARAAENTDADIIVFCGVSFMGESAKILNPEKKVLMPDMSADCAMAHMASAETVKKMREEYDDLAVVCYINSTAELKCMSDVCVTSSNAVNIVKNLPNKNIFFIPDRNLGAYVARQVPEKNIILNDGCCPIHADITPEQVLEQKTLHPTALVLTHPECADEVLKISNFVGSTAEIISYVKNSGHDEFIICTETGVKFKLEEGSANKKFYFPNPCPMCLDMKKNTLKNLLECLENEKNTVEISEEVRKKAYAPLARMLEAAK